MMPMQDGLNNDSNPHVQVPDSKVQFESHKIDSEKQLEELLTNIDKLDESYSLSTGVAGQSHINSLYNQIWSEEVKN